MIIQAKKEDALAVAQLAVKMWADNVPEELAEEMSEIIDSDKGTIFLQKRMDMLWDLLSVS